MVHVSKLPEDRAGHIGASNWRVVAHTSRAPHECFSNHRWPGAAAAAGRSRACHGSQQLGAVHDAAQLLVLATGTQAHTHARV
jgi:hypothetical protein